MNGSPSSIKESKTPGGISKSLLTPCRRVGLSRKWRNSGCSPFISPLSSHNATPEGTVFKKQNKRKNCDEMEDTEVNNETAKQQPDSLYGSTASSPMSCNNSNNNKDITSTPCRSTQISRKKSKVFSLCIKNSQETEMDDLAIKNELQPNKLNEMDKTITNKINIIQETKTTKSSNNMSNIFLEVKPIRVSPEKNVSKPAKTESKSRILSLKKSVSKSKPNSPIETSKIKNPLDKPKPKENSPNNLTKECIVVIQNKILETNPHTIGIETNSAIQESDSELDVPLSALKGESIENVTLNILNDGDFLSKPSMKKIRKLSIIKKHNANPIDIDDSSQNSEQNTNKRTILIKKNYEKVIKPQKAKSTGSITQKDIDDLKARIEMKKKLLLAKAMSIDTEELRSLIKKWQKGCQNALMELLDLMKKKLPDRRNMDYAEILKTLNIPADLVGYDSENDCFITPDDTNVLLSAFKF